MKAQFDNFSSTPVKTQEKWLIHVYARYLLNLVPGLCFTVDTLKTQINKKLKFRSEKFWRENASNLNDKNYELLKILLSLLETARDPLVLCVACFDLGKQRFSLKCSVFRIRIHWTMPVESMYLNS